VFARCPARETASPRPSRLAWRERADGETEIVHAGLYGVPLSRRTGQAIKTAAGVDRRRRSSTRKLQGHFPRAAPPPNAASPGRCISPPTINARGHGDARPNRLAYRERPGLAHKPFTAGPTSQRFKRVARPGFSFAVRRVGCHAFTGGSRMFRTLLRHRFSSRSVGVTHPPAARASAPAARAARNRRPRGHGQHQPASARELDALPASARRPRR
jgi:hypothetical protein